MVIYIYELIDPRDESRFYVGKTNNLKIRLKHHRNGRGNTRCAAYVRDIRATGMRPDMRVIEECTTLDWEERERYWIALLKPFANTSDGGQPGRYRGHSTITRERLRQKFLGRPIPKEQRAQISKSLTGLKQSPETVAKRIATIRERRRAKGLPIPAEDPEFHLKYKRERRRAKGLLVRGSEAWKQNAAGKQRAYYASLTPEQKEEFAARRRGIVGANKGKKFGPQSLERRAEQSARLKAYIAALTPEERAARQAKSLHARWKRE